MVDLWPDGPGAKTNNYMLLMFGIAVLGSFWMGIYGLQQVNLQIVIPALVFFPLMYFSDLLSRKQIRKAPGGFGAMSFSLTLPLTISLVVLGRGKQFSSAFASAGQDFYASIIQGLPQSGIYQFNGFIVPVFESAPVIAITIFTYRLLSGFFRWMGLPRTQARLAAAFIAPLPGGVVFALFHPLSHGLLFMILAVFFVVYLPAVAVLVEDATPQKLVKVAGLGAGTIAGWHIGINIASTMGGLFHWTSVVLSGQTLAQHPAFFFTGLLTAGFIYVSYLASFWYLASLGGRIRLRSLVRGLL